MRDYSYNIFTNPFFDSRPEPLWAFTVQFDISQEISAGEEPSEIDGDPPEWLKNLEKFLKETGMSTPEEWSKKMSKSVAKIPLVHPTSAGNFPLYFAGYMHTYPGRYDNAGQIQVTFNDNVKRDMRYILEQMMHIGGMGYRTEENGEDPTRPTLPDCLWFDMIVRIYDIDRVRQFEPTDDIAGTGVEIFGSSAHYTSSIGTLAEFRYGRCFISKLGSEQNTYEANENVRTIEATITYSDFTKL